MNSMRRHNFRILKQREHLKNVRNNKWLFYQKYFLTYV